MCQKAGHLHFNFAKLPTSKLNLYFADGQVELKAYILTHQLGPPGWRSATDEEMTQVPALGTAVASKDLLGILPTNCWVFFLQTEVDGCSELGI